MACKKKKMDKIKKRATKPNKRTIIKRKTLHSFKTFKRGFEYIRVFSSLVA